MAMFTGFKPQGLQKIASKMGYSGRMEEFDQYLQQNPDKQREMIVYQGKAQEMARGGSVRRMAVGGLSQSERQKLQNTINDNDATELSRRQAQAKLDAANAPPPPVAGVGYSPEDMAKGVGGIIGGGLGGIANTGVLGAPVGTVGGFNPEGQNYQDAPMYDQFKQSDYYKNMPMVGATVTGSSNINGQNYNFPMAMESKAYSDYMKTLGNYQVGDGKSNLEQFPIAPAPMVTPTATAPSEFMSSPGFDPRYEGTDQQSFGQQNQIPTFDYLYSQRPTNTMNPDFEFYRPKPGETLYRTGDAARSANPDTYPQFGGVYPAVEPITGGQYAINNTGERVTVPLGFFGATQGGNRFNAPLDQRTAPQLVDPRTQVTQPAPTPIPPAGSTPLPQQPTPVQNYGSGMSITDVAAQRLSAPSLPSGGQVVGQGISQEAGQYLDTTQGQVSGAVAVPTSLATTTMSQAATPFDAATMSAMGSSQDVNTALTATQAAQIDPTDSRAQVVAAQQTASSVGNLNAAQGNATLLNNPVQRQIQAGELVSGVANAQTAASFTEQIQAASATPSEKATVQGQLATLTANFDASNPPAWAAGTLRAVQAQMAARGLGASSMAGQAMIQGALESALPIAQADANIQASFEQANLSNRQQRAMLAAEQRATFLGLEFTQEFQARVQNSAKISDVANQNFTAEQSIALENSRTANTMNLQNLSNGQALVMAEASALANMDAANLNNRQQAAVQNAQSFLQMDMANVSNQQQTDLFKAQQRVQSLFTDQAAENASRQFNASSKNQTDQFFSNLITQSSQFNATQANAQSQYNAGQRNVLERFNAELNNQRDTFNAQNRLIIDQNNAQWRRTIATSDTATINRVNEINATNLLATSTQAYNNLWNYYGDTMEWAWTSAENELNRYADMSIANLNADTQSEVAKRGASTASGSAIGSLIGTLGSAFIMSCWVAREVYGNDDPRWFIFRMWLKYKAPNWFKNLYEEYGEDYAKFIKNKPIFKWMTRKLMDLVVKEKSKKGMVSYV